MSTQNERILAALANGHTLTESSAKRFLRVRNLRARVAELRSEGNAIYNNDGAYRLGTPSKAVVAAGYRALGPAAFNG